VSLWTAVLLACALAYATKLAGYLVPPEWLAGRATARALALLPVALLAALVGVQTVSAPGPSLVLDARLAGVAAAAVALVLRAPFLVVLVVAAGVAAIVRAAGWAA
jgi:branched-subunit amino acid transport protein